MNFKPFLKKKPGLKNMGPSMGFVSLLFIAMVTSLVFRTLKEPHDPEDSIERFEASTFIPDGHVLIPIEVENYEALSALVDNYAWVDLYTPSENEHMRSKAKKIVKKIRILRAPLDPNHYGIIVPEGYAEAILSYGFLFRVTLNTKTQHTSELLVGKRTKKPAIIFGD